MEGEELTFDLVSIIVRIFMYIIFCHCDGVSLVPVNVYVTLFLRLGTIISLSASH